MTDTRPLQTVYLIGFPEPDGPPGRIERLQKAFGVDEAMARHFLENMPVAVKRKASPDEAKAYADVLKGIGAKVQIAADASTGQMVRIVDDSKKGVLPTASLPGGGAKPTPQPRVIPARKTDKTEFSSDNPLPPLAPFSPHRVALERPDVPEHDGRDFWESLPTALKAPFMGKGVLWLMLLSVSFFFAGCFLSVGCLLTRILIGGGLWLAYMGLLGTYFSKSVNQGLCGFTDSPELPDLTPNGWKELRLRGVPLAILSLMLFAIPSYMGWAALGLVGGVEVESRPWKAAEKFTGSQGEPVVISVGSEPQDAVDAEGIAVRVDPRKGIVTPLSELAKADESGGSLIQALIFFLVLMVPLLYWPMALTVAALSNNMIDLFNPIFVIKGIVRGGLKYITVAGVGAMLFAGSVVLVVALNEGAAKVGGAGGVGLGLVTLILPLVIGAYVSGVQAHLIGRILHDDPVSYKEFNI